METPKTPLTSEENAAIEAALAAQEAMAEEQKKQPVVEAEQKPPEARRKPLLSQEEIDELLRGIPKPGGGTPKEIIPPEKPYQEDLVVPKPKEENGLSEEEKQVIENESQEAQMDKVEPHPEDLVAPTAEGEKAPEGKAEKEESPEELSKELDGLRLNYTQAETAKNKTEKGVESIGGIRERLGSWLRGEQKTKERKAAIESDNEKAQAAFAEIKDKYDKTLKEYTKSLYKKKEVELSSDPEKTKKLKEYAKTELFNETFFNEVTKLNQARMGNLPPKEQKFCGKAFNAWKDLPGYQKWLLSIGVATGVAFLAPLAVPTLLVAPTFTAGYFGLRLSRAVLGTFGGRLAGGAYQKYIIEAGREKTTGEIKAEAQKAIEAAENFEDIMKAMEASSAVGRQKIAERAKVERWHKLGQVAVIAGTAGLASWGAGKMMDSYFEAAGLKAPVAEKPRVAGQPAEVKPGAPPISEEDWARGSSMEKTMEPGKYVKLEDLGILKIGARGPEGAIIDYLRANPDLAKSWGWDGNKMSINQFAGIKSHTMWSELAKAEIAKPEVQAQLEKLGYSRNMDGYAEMMRRIGKGYVDIDPKSGIMKGFTEDTTFLKVAEVLKKAVPWQAEAPAELRAPTELSAGRPQISAMPEETGGISEGEMTTAKLQGEPLPASVKELEQMGFTKEEIADMGERAKLSGKNFVTGSDYENYANKLREGGHFDIVDKDGVTIRPTAEALAVRLDETIAGTLGMEPSAYDTLKEINLEKFVKVKPTTLAEHFEWKPAKKVIDQYLKINKFLDPDDLKKTTGEFFKKIIKIDIGK